MTWEIDFLNGIQRHIANPVFNFFFRYFTLLCEPVVVILFCVIILIPKKSRKMGIRITLAILGGLLIGNLFLKNALARQRPYTDPRAVIDAAHLLIAKPKDYSFPSGHTMASFNAALIVFYENTRLGIIALAGAAMIAFSRLYLFVHYPTDILGGLFIAVFTSLVSFSVCRKLFEKFSFEFKRRPAKK